MHLGLFCHHKAPINSNQHFFSRFPFYECQLVLEAVSRLCSIYYLTDLMWAFESEGETEHFSDHEVDRKIHTAKSDTEQDLSQGQDSLPDSALPIT